MNERPEGDPPPGRPRREWQGMTDFQLGQLQSGSAYVTLGMTAAEIIEGAETLGIETVVLRRVGHRTPLVTITAGPGKDTIAQAQGLHDWLLSFPLGRRRRNARRRYAEAVASLLEAVKP